MLLVTDFYYIHRVAILFMTFYCFLALFRYFLSLMCVGKVMLLQMPWLRELGCLVLYWFGWSLFLRICITVICQIFCLLFKVAFLVGFSKKKKKKKMKTVIIIIIIF